MTNLLTKAGLGVALVATSLTVAAPAEAQRYYHRDRGDATGAAVVAGIAGLAIGAALASSADQRRYDRYPSYNYRYDRYPQRYNQRYDRYPRYNYRQNQRCWRERVWDDWRGRWLQVRRCR